LKQPQYQPLPVEEQVLVIFAGVRGFLDRVKVEDVTRFEQAFRSEVKAQAPDILDSIRSTREITKETEEKLTRFLESFVKNFA
jgi:F-type H+-transporting ATPase subunit alpha